MKLSLKNKIYSIAGLVLLASGLYEAIIDDNLKIAGGLFAFSIVFSFAPLKEVAAKLTNKIK